MRHLATVEDACDLVTDGTHYTPKNVDSGVPFLTVKDVTDAELDFLDCALISEDDYRAARDGNSAPQKGDVLFSKDGTVGKVHVVTTERPFAVLSSLAILRPKLGRVDADYLGHVLRSPLVLDEALRRKTGSAIRRIILSDLRRVSIPLPALSQQRRIAQVLDRAEALRAKRRATLAQLDLLTQALFLDLFRDSHHNVWRPTALPDAYWFQEGPGVRSSQFRLAGIKLLNVGNIEKDGTLNLAKTDRCIAVEEALGKYKHFLVDAGDLVIASSGITFDSDGMLRTRGAFVGEEQLPLCMNTSTIRFKAIHGVSDLRFLWVWLNSREFRHQITKRVTGSAQQNFGPSHLASLVMTLPPLAVQSEFARRVVAVEKLKATYRASLAALSALFTSLQHRAFRGEL